MRAGWLVLCTCAAIRFCSAFVPQRQHQAWPQYKFARSNRPYMIDNFFRLHEKNRQLNWDDYFGKARYDFPQSFGSSTCQFNSGIDVKEGVQACLRRGIRQLPASASIDLAIIAIDSRDITTEELVLEELSRLLPGSTHVIGWSNGAAAPEFTHEASEPKAFHSSGDNCSFSIALASWPSVTIRHWTVEEDQLMQWDNRLYVDAMESPYDNTYKKQWELLVRVGMNEAYKDPPVFLMLGSIQDPTAAQVALRALDFAYPGTAKVGGIVRPGYSVALLSREGGGNRPAGNRVMRYQAQGLLGLSLVGDIRALTYVSQGAKLVHDIRLPILRAKEVSKDGKTVLSFMTPEGCDADLPVEAISTRHNSLTLGIGDSTPTLQASQEAEGADRWSLVSVRGGRQPAIVLAPQKWGLCTETGGLHLYRRVQPGDYLSWWWRDAETAGATEVELVEELAREIGEEWNKPELGVMKFRPSGALAVTGPGYPGLGLEGSFRQSISDTLLDPGLAGFRFSGGQFAPLNPSNTSGLFEEALVMTVFACKAKRRDVKEVRFPDNMATGSSTRGILDLPLLRKMAPIDKETGEVTVNRQAALIGTDVRVDNMAWNLREERIFPSSLYESVVWSKERELYLVREDAPLMNLMRTVMMAMKSSDSTPEAKTTGLDVVAALRARPLLGSIMRGSPFHGMLTATYKAEEVALAMVEEQGVGVIAVHVDQKYYGGRYQDARDVKNALRSKGIPVIIDDLVLYPYQYYLAKLFGAEGIRIGVHLLSDEDLTYQVKICKSLKLTPLLSVSSLHQLRRAVILPVKQPHVILIDNLDLRTMTLDLPPKHRAIEWLKDEQVQAGLRGQVENSSSVPPLIVVEGAWRDSTEELRKAGVDAFVISNVDLQARQAEVCGLAAAA